jgi:CheY-like chemotaxis protein
VETAKPGIEARGHRLEVKLGRCPMVAGDATRLTQVFGNLLDNAVKYTAPGGDIVIEAAESAEGMAVISVRDNGVGIPPAMLHRIFEPFHQVSASLARSQGGLGLGLALVRRLVEMHGGKVTARSAGEGQGAEFAVHLPPTVTRRPAARAVAAVQGAAVKRRILVIDDNVDGADMTCAMLAMLGHDVTPAYSGSAGLDAARALAPEVILLDIGLPDIDGYEVARRLRSDESTTGCVLVALTGYGQARDRAQAAAAGFDAHCLKPLSLEALAACCEQRRQPPSAQSRASSRK